MPASSKPPRRKVITRIILISVVLGLLYSLAIIGLSPPKFESDVVIELSSEPPWGESLNKEFRADLENKLVSDEVLNEVGEALELQKKWGIPSTMVNKDLEGIIGAQALDDDNFLKITVIYQDEETSLELANEIPMSICRVLERRHRAALEKEAKELSQKNLEDRDLTGADLYELEQELVPEVLSKPIIVHRKLVEARRVRTTGIFSELLWGLGRGLLLGGVLAGLAYHFLWKGTESEQELEEALEVEEKDQGETW